jgi:hypothetical protein
MVSYQRHLDTLDKPAMPVQVDFDGWCAVARPATATCRQVRGDKALVRADLANLQHSLPRWVRRCNPWHFRQICMMRPRYLRQKTTLSHRRRYRALDVVHHLPGPGAYLKRDRTAPLSINGRQQFFYFELSCWKDTARVPEKFPKPVVPTSKSSTSAPRKAPRHVEEPARRPSAHWKWVQRVMSLVIVKFHGGPRTRGCSWGVDRPSWHAFFASHRATSSNKQSTTGVTSNSESDRGSYLSSISSTILYINMFIVPT